MGKNTRGPTSTQSPIYCPNCNKTVDGQQMLMAQTTQPATSPQQTPQVQAPGQMPQQPVSPQSLAQQTEVEVSLPGVHDEQVEVAKNGVNIIIPPVSPEEAFFMNILRLNIGREVRVHTDLTHGPNEYTGILNSSGNDYIIVADTQTGEVHVILTVLVQLVTFLEAISLDTGFLAQEQELFSTRR